MLLGTFDASLLEYMSAEKDVLRAGQKNTLYRFISKR